MNILTKITKNQYLLDIIKLLSGNVAAQLINLVSISSI